MGYYLDTFFEKEHKPLMEKWDKEYKEMERKQSGIIDKSNNKMTSEQIRASIKVNEETYKQASGTLREILDEKEPRRAYYLERLITSLNLCADICKHRAKLEYDLRKAIQAGE